YVLCVRPEPVEGADGTFIYGRPRFDRLTWTAVAASARCASALVDRHHLAPRRAGIELARTADLLVRIGDHLHPLRNPADRAREREDAREHRRRDAQRALHDAGVKVDVGIELALDEVLVLQRDALQFH